MTAAIDLRGAELPPIQAVPGKPITVLFDFGTVDISGFTFVGHVAKVLHGTPVETMDFVRPDTHSFIMVLTGAQATSLAPWSVWYFTIDQTAPTVREMFYGQIRFGC